MRTCPVVSGRSVSRAFLNFGPPVRIDPRTAFCADGVSFYRSGWLRRGPIDRGRTACIRKRRRAWPTTELARAVEIGSGDQESRPLLASGDGSYFKRRVARAIRNQVRYEQERKTRRTVADIIPKTARNAAGDSGSSAAHGSSGWRRSD